MTTNARQPGPKPARHQGTLGPRKRAVAAALRDSLNTIVLDEPSALGTFTVASRALLDAAITLAYRPTITCAGFKVDTLFVDGGPSEESARRAFDRVISANPSGWAYYDPFRPQRDQRNVARTLRWLESGPSARAPIMALAPAFGIVGHDHLRVLVCDGDFLLQWVGGFRPEPFTEREVGILRMFVRPLGRRLLAEARLGNDELYRSAFEQALERLSAPAYLVSRSGATIHANAAGRTLWGSSPSARAEIDAARRGCHSQYDATPIVTRGQPLHTLIVKRPCRTDLGDRVAFVAAAWKLTPRQVEVLRVLVEGHANKTIAERLRCAENTVELHVTGLMRASKSQSRAEIVARFWRITLEH